MLLSRDTFSSFIPRLISTKKPDPTSLLASRMNDTAHPDLPLPSYDCLKARFKAMLEQFLVDRKLERALETGSTKQLKKQLRIFCEKANETCWMLQAYLYNHLPQNRDDVKVAFLTSIYEIYENILEQKTNKGQPVFNEYNPGLDFVELTGFSPSMLFYRTESHAYNPLSRFSLSSDQIFEPAKSLALEAKGKKALQALFKDTDFIQDRYPLRTVTMEEPALEREIFELENRRRVNWYGLAADRLSLLNSTSLSRGIKEYELSILHGSAEEHIDQVLGHELGHTLLRLAGFPAVHELHVTHDGEDGYFISNRQIHEFLAFTATILIRPEIAYDILLANQVMPSYRLASEFLRECINDFIDRNDLELSISDFSSDVYKAKSLRKLLTNTVYRRLNLYIAKRFLARSRKILVQIKELNNKEAQQEPGFKKAALGT